jgi:hypothetical protein
MVRIEERQIKEARRIREKYLKSVSNIKESESKLIETKKELISVIQTIEKAVNEIDEEMMKEKINNLESKIRGIQEDIKPDIIIIKKLEKDADTLFESIKQKHPNITKEELQESLLPYIDDIK